MFGGMPPRKIRDDERHAHFATFSCYRRRRRLDHDRAKYCSFNLYDEEKVRKKLTYIHENPVRAGLVARPCDWAFSSARYDEQRRIALAFPIRWIA
jgi:hypothetical protein